MSNADFVLSAAISSKNVEFNGWAFTDVLGNQVVKMSGKTAHKEAHIKQKMN